MIVSEVAGSAILNSLPPAKAIYGVLGIVRRESTIESYKDVRITRAMSLIGERGCGKLSVAEVAQEMGCCSHLAQILFKRVTGLTMRDWRKKNTQ